MDVSTMAAVVYQMATNKIDSLRCRMVIRILNTTMAKLMTTMMSTGQANSAYSRPWVCPRAMPMTPAATVMFQKMALNTPSLWLNSSVRSNFGK